MRSCDDVSEDREVAGSNPGVARGKVEQLVGASARRNRRDLNPAQPKLRIDSHLPKDSGSWEVAIAADPDTLR